MNEIEEMYLSDDEDDIFEEPSMVEENISSTLSVTSEDFKIHRGVVDFESLLIPDPIKKNRGDTYLGLSRSISELGIVNPIHVMVSEGFSDYVEENGSEEGYEGYKYILLDGFRRVWAGYKNGLSRCDAIIWDFKDKDKGVDLAVPLSLVIGKKAKHSWSEIWYMYQILESQSAMTPGSLEYLLSLEPGDAMKLKDIMQSGYDDVIADLLSNKKTLAQAYNILQKLRKEEDILRKEDDTGIAKMEQAGDMLDGSKGSVLSNEEVNDILEMTGGDLELQEDNFDEMLGMDNEVQKVGERHPIDPALKAETMLRDNYNCVCCHSTDYLPMRYKLSLLQSHHKIAVAHGGPDSANNIVTVCMSCHTLIHCLLWSGLKFGMSKEDFEQLPEEEKTRFKKVMEIAKYDWEAATRMGKTKEDIHAEYARPSQFKMPGTDLRENVNAIKSSGGHKEL